MSSRGYMEYAACFPKDAQRSASDVLLPQIVRLLKRIFYELQSRPPADALRLDKRAVEELAGMLVDFAVDIHNELGLWEAYERYNREFFGVPLPITEGDNAGFSVDRMRHLMWRVYPRWLENATVIPPDHPGLHAMAGAAHEFLREHVGALPKDSGLRAFLGSPNEYAWDAKRKLIWLGTRSYLFRLWFTDYMAEHEAARNSIDDIDDFICQQCTPWSGLGANDILAAALNIPEAQRQELRSWYERHAAYYKMVAVNDEVLEALNVISNRPYTIRMNMAHPFKVNQLVFGSLTPWKGEWYWSGTQRAWDEASDKQIEQCRQSLKTKTSIVARYWKEYERTVRDRMAEHYRRMLQFYGTDLILYPDGASMAADWDREMKALWQSAPKDQVRDAMKRHGMTEPRTNISLPQNVREHPEGLAVFINPEEGKEIALYFHRIMAALKKNGGPLTADESKALRDFMEADAISPAFVKRVVREYGAGSLRAALGLENQDRPYWLDYALRGAKGHFFRKRYPTLSVA